MRINALVQGHTVVMDVPERVGGTDEGPNPKPLILTALAGCTAMEVVGLLRKAGKVLTGLEVRVNGELSAQKPLTYVSVHIIYDMHGADADVAEALLAVERSHDELCGVIAMMRRIMPVTSEALYNDRNVAIPTRSKVSSGKAAY